MNNTGFLWIILAVTLFGILHSLVASLKAKDFANKHLEFLSKKYYRLFFIFFAIITFLPILAMIGMLPDRIIYLISVPYRYLTGTIQIISVFGAFYSLLQTDLSLFLGIKQQKDPEIDEFDTLIIKGPYRYVRHPIYFCSLLFIWLTPIMTWNILAFNISASIYLTLGTIFEEKKLIKAFGSAYLDYQNNTPMLFPLKKRKK